jgi:hypothetical protein
MSTPHQLIILPLYLEPWLLQMQWACTAHGTEACRLRISFLVSQSMREWLRD